MEVWDWDRLTANDFIGGLSMRVGEILDFTKEKPFSSWYKLLDEKRTKAGNERILADDEAVKVREGRGRGKGRREGGGGGWEGRGRRVGGWVGGWVGG